MNALPYTSALAGFFALFMVLLSLMVSLRRARAQAVFGDAGDETLRRRIRAHGNFTEYAPLALILVGLMEFSTAPVSLVAILAGALALSRVLHALGMLYGNTPVLRAVAMLTQHAAFAAAGISLVLRALQSL